MKNNINALIMEAMKNHDSVRTETLRAIKSAFLNWQTSKENAGKELTEADEIQIIKKMVKQRQESVEQYLAAGRKELADAEQAQINVLETFLPKAASDFAGGTHKHFQIPVVLSVTTSVSQFLRSIPPELRSCPSGYLSEYHTVSA